MWSTNQYIPPARGYADPTKPVPNLPTPEEYKEDDLLLFSILAHKPPTKAELLSYKPRDWNKLEHLESYIAMRKAQLSNELNTVRQAHARALAELDRRMFSMSPTKSELERSAEPALAEEVAALKTRELEVLDRRFARIEQIVRQTAWGEINPKQQQLKRIIADPQPKNYPNVRVPRGWNEFREYPEYMRLDCARLLYRHAEGQLFKSTLRDSKWHKDKDVADFNAARDEYNRDRIFKEYLKKNYDVIRDW